MILSKENLKAAVDLAEKSFQKWAKVDQNGSGTYNHNKIDGCLIGTKCEVAIAQFFLENNIFAYSQFLDLNSVNDLLAGNINIESKGLRENHWDNFKRCIPPSQLSKYVKKKAIVIWGTTKIDPKDPIVNLRGWNYATEVKEKGVYRRTICDNIWLKNDEDMRNMNDLIVLLKSQKHFQTSGV